MRAGKQCGLSVYHAGACRIANACDFPNILVLFPCQVILDSYLGLYFFSTVNKNSYMGFTSYLELYLVRATLAKHLKIHPLKLVHVVSFDLLINLTKNVLLTMFVFKSS
jgi:hypothetical protein